MESHVQADLMPSVPEPIAHDVAPANAKAATVAFSDSRPSLARRRREFWCVALLLTVAFGGVLYSVGKLSFNRSLHSHLPLIPIVTWFLWRFVDRKDEAGNGSARSLWASGATGLLGLAALAVCFMLRREQPSPATEWLWAGVLSYLLLLLGTAQATLGWNHLRPHRFSLALMFFAIPLPVFATDALSILLQRGSAEVTSWMLQLTGLPVLREGLIFQLPGLVIKVAEECSGIRSTLVLFITSLIAGKLYLCTGWKRWALALATIPLGLLRNALRITLLSWMTVNVDPNFIHGPVHHRGGPIFFVLSLIPLFGLLWYFRRSEAKQSPSRE